MSKNEMKIKQHYLGLQAIFKIYGHFGGSLVRGNW